MISVLSVKNMKKSDEYAIEHIASGRELMYRAGAAVFEILKSYEPPFAIVCGSGNNAGDGYVAALLLCRAGIDCAVYTLSDKRSEDGAFYYEQCLSEGVIFLNFDKASDLRPYKTVVDCILGTGFSGEIRGAAKTAINAINTAGASGAKVVSVDINSGLCGDSGLCAAPKGCVISDLTISIGGFKSGHFLNMAKDCIAQKVNCDIGIVPVEKPYRLLEAGDISPVFAPRKNFSNKSTYGYVALVGGSAKYGGAIRLAHMANAAMRSGAGVATAAVPAGIAPTVSQSVLESTVLPLSDYGGEFRFVEEEIRVLADKYRVIAFGMGAGLGDGAREILKYLLSYYKGTLIVDADGLTLLAAIGTEAARRAECNIVLTPHCGELSRLIGRSSDEILNNPVECVREFASTMVRTDGSERAVVVLLKGAATVVSDGVQAYIVDAGCAGMATAGSGDVLSGVLAAVCANFGRTESRCSLAHTVAAAAYICGKAGEAAERKVGSVSMIASDTVAEISGVVKHLALD